MEVTQPVKSFAQSVWSRDVITEVTTDTTDYT